jgi:hypothetical protein
MSDAFRLEVFVDKDGKVYDEVILDKVGDDTGKWDYLLASKQITKLDAKEVSCVKDA